MLRVVCTGRASTRGIWERGLPPSRRERLISNAVLAVPRDDSAPIIPPSHEQVQQLLTAAETFRDIAPLTPEAIELAAETGLTLTLTGDGPARLLLDAKGGVDDRKRAALETLLGARITFAFSG